MNEMQLKNIVAETIGIDAEGITDELSRTSCEEWDSFNHLILIAELERASQLKLPAADVEKMKTIADLKAVFCSA